MVGPCAEKDMMLRLGYGRYVWFAISLWLLASGHVHALDHEPFKVNYRIFNRSDGLRGNAPLDAAEDSLGFVWVSTYDGINRFDGQKFRFFSKQSLGIAAKYYVYIGADKAGMLWILSGDLNHDLNHQIDGISESEIRILNPYSLVYQAFEDRFPNAPFCQDEVLSFCEDANGLYLMLTNGRIYLYDGQFRLIYQPKDGYLTNWVLSSDKGMRYLAQGQRLLTINSANGQLTQDKLPFYTQMLMFWGEDHVLMGGFPMNGERINIKKGNGPVRPLEVEGLTDAAYMILLGVDHQNYAWLRQKDSVFVLALQAEKARVIHRFSLGQVAPAAVFHGIRTAHHFWLSTPGIFAYVKLVKNHFQSYLVNQVTSVRDLQHLPDGRILASTYAGAKIIDLQSGHTESVLPSVGYGGYKIDCQGGICWVGTHGHSIERYDLSTGQATTFMLNIDERRHWAATVIPYIEPSGRVWVGMNGGLAALSPQEKDLKIVSLKAPWSKFNGALVRQFIPSPEGTWLATSNGIHLVDLAAGKILSSYSTPLGANISFLQRDEKGNFWVIAHKDDLMYWDRKTNTFEVFNLYTPLLDNVLHCALSDKYGNVWLSSNNGLYCLSPQTKQVKAYFKEDGLPDSEFNSESYHVLPDGRFAMGGINGFVVFDPNTMRHDIFNTNRTQLADIVTYHPQTGAKEYCMRELVEQGQLSLPPDRQKLELNFCLINPAVKHLAYFYRINARSPDDPWIQIQNGSLLLNGLGYGPHTIEMAIKADMDLLFSGIVKTTVYVNYPWYMRWWAMLLYLVLLGLAIRFYIGIRLRQQMEANQRLEEEVALRTRQLYKDKLLIEAQNTSLSQLNYFKDRMLGLVGHELKGPLLSLFGIAEKIAFLIKRERWDDVSKIGTLIDQKVLDLQHTLDNLLRWGQSMPGGDPSPTAVNLPHAIESEWASLKATADAKNLRYQLSAPHNEAFTIWFDPQALSVILRNLLHNAIKFSPVGGLICLQIKAQDEHIHLRISDEGAGFPLEVRQNINQAHFFFSAKGTAGEAGTGLGLRLCIELLNRNSAKLHIDNGSGGGARVSLILPVYTP